MELLMVLPSVPMTVEPMMELTLECLLLGLPMALLLVLPSVPLMVLPSVPMMVSPSEWMLERPLVGGTSVDLLVEVLVERALSSIPRLQSKRQQKLVSNFDSVCASISSERFDHSPFHRVG